MYALYKVTDKLQSVKYSLVENNISLFGCNNGYIPWLLKRTLTKKDTEPLKWNINIREALDKADYHNQTIFINLKPNSSIPNLSLYELQQVWGYSTANWTPMMFYLKGIFVDEKPNKINIDSFERKIADIDDNGFIISFVYVNGTVKDGDIEGKWTAPRPSSTNSVLLWSEAFDYFVSEYKKITN
jgi:hypothetical protein